MLRGRGVGDSELMSRDLWLAFEPILVIPCMFWCNCRTCGKKAVEKCVKCDVWRLLNQVETRCNRAMRTTPILMVHRHNHGKGRLCTRFYFAPRLLCYNLKDTARREEKVLSPIIYKSTLQIAASKKLNSVSMPPCYSCNCVIKPSIQAGLLLNQYKRSNYFATHIFVADFT